MNAQTVHTPRTRSGRAKLSAVAVSFGLLAAACGGGGGGGSSEGGSGDNILVSGSSTVAPISARAAELFEDQTSGVSITVDGPGTGDGFKLFCEGETDMSGASRAIKESEAADCDAAGIEYVELMVAFDGIAVLTSPNNDIDCVSFGDLYALLGPESEGFSDWSDAQAIADELGTSNSFPDARLDVSAPGTESGTYDSFIEIVLEGQAEERGVESDAFIRTDISGIAKDNVIIQGIGGSDSSLGWVGFAFAEENADTVKALDVDGGSGCTTATVETIADGSYPVSRPLFVYVNKAKAADNETLVDFVDYYLNDAYTEAVTMAFGETGYVALPDDQLQAAKDAWANR